MALGTGFLMAGMLGFVQSGHGAEQAAPLSILILDGGHGDEGSLDPGYAERLQAKGIHYAHVRIDDLLTEAFLKKFDVFVLGWMPIDNAANDLFPWRAATFRSNMDRITARVKEGAGLLVYADLTGEGAAKLSGWNNELRSFGAELSQGCILDPAHAMINWKGHGDTWYVWTETISKHPATEGIKRIYYPSVNMRWDDSYTAPPLKLDASWTPLVRAENSAKVAFMEDREWRDASRSSGDLVWAAARPFGKGRMAIVGMPPIYSHRLGFHKNAHYMGWIGEACVGALDGIILEKGDGQNPSDTGKLLMNLYGWLAGSGVASPRYAEGQPIEKERGPFEGRDKETLRPVDWDSAKPLRSWAHVTVPEAGGDLDDPRVQGEIKFFKALVGVHSSYSDGRGTVAEYADAAKKAGYSAVAFTEAFENLTPEKWQNLVAECRSFSTDDVILLPGFDIEDFAGNHYLVINPTFFPRPSWLSSDGKRLQKVALISAPSIGNCLIVAHRAGATPLPVERLKFHHGVSVATYRKGKLVDDSRNVYACQVANASGPIPIAVHEVFSPTEVAAAAAGGLQQLMPADTVRHAVDYFRSGMNHYFTFPSRHLISEGPIVEQFVISHPGATDDTGKKGTLNQFRIWIKVTADVPLSEVILFDGFTPVRRWTPGRGDFSTTANFQHVQQRHLYLVARDEKGREVITPSIRTILPRHVFRCPDRQNWLGDVGVQYTGTKLSDGANIIMPVKGSEEGNGLLTNDKGACMAPVADFPFISRELVVTDIRLDEKYKTATYVDIAMDAKPSFPSEKSTVYEGKYRRWNFTGTGPDQPYPTILEYDLKLKRDVEPRDPAGLFPQFANLRGAKGAPNARLRAWMDDSGKVETAQIKPGEVVDVPPGTLVAGFIPLTEGFEVAKDAIGLRSGKRESLPAGKRFSAKVLITAGHEGWRGGMESRFDENPEVWLRALGIGGRTTPFQLELQRGKLERIAFQAETLPEQGIVDGSVKVTGEIPYRLPLQISGINPRWPSGIWRPEDGLRWVGIFEGKSWPLLDVEKAGRFIAGNLITAGNGNLTVSVVQWTATRLQMELHNSTDAAIKTRIMTPVTIPGYKALDQEVEVPAGSSLMVESPSLRKNI